MSKPETPTPPDPATTAAAQTTSNLATAKSNAELNRVNTNTPYGSLNYSTTGTNPDGTPQYQADVSLSPQEQTLFDIGTANQGNIARTAQGMLGQVQNSYASPIDLSSAPGVASSVQNNGPGIASSVRNNGPGITGTVQQDGATTADAIRNAQGAAYRSQTQYLDPQFEQGQRALDSKLANEGVAKGSQAENDAQNNFALQKRGAYQSAQDAATTSGQAEQARLYGQALSSAGLQNQANQQGYGQGLSTAELQNQANQQGFGQGLSTAQLQNQGNQQYIANLFALRNQPLNEFSALTRGSAVQSPNFPNVPGSTMANTNVGGIYNDAFNNQMAAYNAKTQGINNLFSLGGGLGAAYLGNPAAFA